MRGVAWASHSGSAYAGRRDVVRTRDHHHSLDLRNRARRPGYLRPSPAIEGPRSSIAVCTRKSLVTVQQNQTPLARPIFVRSGVLAADIRTIGDAATFIT